MYIYCICVYEYSIYLYVVYRLELLDTYHILILTIVFLDETRKLFVFQALATFSSFSPSISKIENFEQWLKITSSWLFLDLMNILIFANLKTDFLCLFESLSMLKRLCNLLWSKCYFCKIVRETKTRRRLIAASLTYRDSINCLYR